MRLTVDGDLMLLHRFEERGLGTRRRAVHLVDEHRRWRRSAPARNSHSPVRGPYTDVPVMSAGSRSGVHCTRPKRPPIAAASDLASNVFPVPGAPSTKRCPPESKATRARRTVCGAPRTALSTASESATGDLAGIARSCPVTARSTAAWSDQARRPERGSRTDRARSIRERVRRLLAVVVGHLGKLRELQLVSSSAMRSSSQSASIDGSAGPRHAERGAEREPRVVDRE